MPRIDGISVLLLAGAFVCFACDQNERASARGGAGVASGSASGASNEKLTTIDPCGLLTQAEASAFLAGTATATPSAKVDAASSCIWEAREPRRGLVVMASTPAQVGARASGEERGDTLEKRFAEVVHSQSGEGGATPVPGLADAAVWAARAGQLWVMKKDRALVSVSFHGESAADAFDKCRAVAQKLVPRL